MRLSVVAAVAALALAAFAAWGQVAASSSRPLSEEQMAGFRRIIRPDPAQEDAVRTLRDAAAVQIEAGDAKALDLIHAYTDLPEEQRTIEAHERLTADLAKVTPDRATFERQALKDLRALLHDDQAARWPAFDRFLRRERMMTHMAGLSAGVNLLGLTEMIQPDEQDRAGVAETLSRYEIDLDRALAELEKRQPELDAASNQAQAAEDEEALAEVRRQGWELFARVANLNKQYLRRLRATMSVDKGAALRDAFEKASSADAYTPDGRDVAIRVAGLLADLDEGTRAKLTPIVTDYTRSYDDHTLRLARLAHRMQDTGQMWEGDDRDEFNRLQQERSDLVEKAVERVQTVIGPERWRQVWVEGNRRVEEVPRPALR